jgi:endonuclease III-like uncharacterized protein
MSKKSEPKPHDIVQPLSDECANLIRCINFERQKVPRAEWIRFIAELRRNKKSSESQSSLDRVRQMSVVLGVWLAQSVHETCVEKVREVASGN